MTKIFDILLTKTYKIQISDESEEEAKRLSEFYIGDILDISNKEERKKDNFQIENIECVINDAFECVEVK